MLPALRKKGFKKIEGSTLTKQACSFSNGLLQTLGATGIYSARQITVIYEKQKSAPSPSLD